jgi:hypothetical protein
MRQQLPLQMRAGYYAGFPRYFFMIYTGSRGGGVEELLQGVVEREARIAAVLLVLLLPLFCDIYCAYFHGGEGCDCEAVRRPQHAARLDNKTTV